MSNDPEGTHAQLLANALSRAEIAENDLRAEILHSAEMRKERNNARAECAWLAKRLIRLRESLNNIASGAEDEGDRVYFGSTNDADWLKEIARDVDAYAFDRIMRESKWPDYIEASAKANSRATTAEAEAESWKSQFHSAAEAASMYVEFYEQHHADFDPAGNYIPHSQIDGDLRAAKAEAERLRAERDELREKVERLEGERNALSAEMDQATGRIDDIGAEAKALRSENAALQEAVFRAEHRELVNAANWHKAAEDAKSGKWANLLARLEGMTAEERRAKVVLSMDKQREIRRARTALEGKTDGK